MIKPQLRNAYLNTSDIVISKFNNMLLWKGLLSKSSRLTPFVAVNNLWKCVRINNSILSYPELSKLIKDAINQYGEI